jgi:polysaccharide biosynthesis transport protein
MERAEGGIGRPSMQKTLDTRYQFAKQAAPEPENDEIDILGLFRTLWRGKWIIAIFALIAIAIGGNYAYRVAIPTYTATAQMALQLRTETVVNLESVLSGVSSDYYSINTEMEVIRSRELMARLVDRLDLVNDPEFNASLRPEEGMSLRKAIGIARQQIVALIRPPVPVEAIPPGEDLTRNGVIAAVRGAMGAEMARDSYVFTVSATTWDPIKSALMANTLAQLYRDDQIAVKVQATENAASWLSGRVSELRSELETRQRAITDLRSQSALVSPETLAALNARSVELQGRLQVATAELDRVSAVHNAMQASLASDNAAKVVAAQDVQLEAIASSIVRGDPSGQMRFDRRFQQLLVQSEGERNRVAAVVAELQAEASQISLQFQDQSASLLELQQLERETDATRVLYETFLTRLKETSVQEGVHQADSRILSEATPGSLVAPRKSRILALSLILGVMLGAAVVLIREFMQNTFRTSDDLQKYTGYTVLGQVPKIPVKGRAETINYLMSKPTSAAAEAVRNLRTSILLSNIDNPPKIIMLTSSIPGEGKTTQSISLAQNLAGLGKKVILLEGDIRRRTFSAYFQDAQKVIPPFLTG